MIKKTQKQIVYQLVKENQGKITAEYNRMGLDKFITDASRYLRELANDEGSLVSENVENKNYKKWFTKDYYNVKKAHEQGRLFI